MRLMRLAAVAWARVFGRRRTRMVRRAKPFVEGLGRGMSRAAIRELEEHDRG